MRILSCTSLATLVRVVCVAQAGARQFFVASRDDARDLSRQNVVELCNVLREDRVFTCNEKWASGAAGETFDGVRDLKSALQITADSLGPEQMKGVRWTVLGDQDIPSMELGKRSFRIPKPFLGFFSFEEDVTLFAEEIDVEEPPPRVREGGASRRLSQSDLTNVFASASGTGRGRGHGRRGLLDAESNDPSRNSLVAQHAVTPALGAMSTFAGGCTSQCRSDTTFYYSSTGQGATVYIVDGVVKEHVQFKDISNGKTRLSNDRFLSESARMSDPECAGDHGTHVAAVAAGFEYGSSKSPTIISVAVQPGCGVSGMASDLVEGLDWIVKRQRSFGSSRPPAVVSMSLILESGSEVGDLVRDKVDELLEEGVVVVAAAGNFHEDACDFVPANIPNVITVAGASVFAGGGRAIPWSWSNFGECVDVFAPAVDVEAASPECYECTAVFSGTSQATPFVTGIVAQYLATNPTASPSDVRRYILAESTDQFLETFRYPYQSTPNLFAQSLVGLKVRQVRHSDN